MHPTIQSIRPEFHACAAWQHHLDGAANASETDSAADSGGMMTLEMRDNSFQVMMNRVDWLLKSGMREDVSEAFEIVRRAWQSRAFGDDLEGKLEDKLEQITEILNEDRALGGPFTRSALGLEPREQAPIFTAKPALLPFLRRAA